MRLARILCGTRGGDGSSCTVLYAEKCRLLGINLNNHVIKYSK